MTAKLTQCDIDGCTQDVSTLVESVLAFVLLCIIILFVVLWSCLNIQQNDTITTDAATTSTNTESHAASSRVLENPVW